ncbi:MAG TPA: amidohydrolase [Thermodesulfobacteriota bacterium]|nr:amidohydrolase [Thermodesulfobacteriota bacterium]
MLDLILFDANVITMDPLYPKAEGVLIKDGKILSATASDALKKWDRTRATKIDCKGRTVLPGFIDLHCHLHALAESHVTLNLEPHHNVRSINDIQTKIRDYSQKLPPGTWIRGRGYNEFSLTEKRHPNRWDLDRVTSAHPIKLTHRTGHAHVLNSLALQMVGISNETPDPPDGLIDRDLKTGEPTGILYRMGNFLSKKIPPLENHQLDQGIKKANDELLSMGITSVQDASSHNGIEQWKMFQCWKDKRILKSRVVMMLGTENFSAYRKEDFETEIDKNQLRPAGVKIILDETTGHLHPDQDELNEMVLKIHQSGFQACLHAVEENTVEAACSAIEYALKKLPKSDHRHRIEHCSVCPPSLARKLASLGITVVTQPSFIYYGGDRYLRTVPAEALKHLYPIKTLLKSGVKMAASSDCPIAPANPLIGIYAASSRTTETGEAVLSEERITPEEALRMYGENAAKATFDESTKGSISPGKLADLVVLNEDPTKVSINEIKDIKVTMTIVDGEIVWEKP